MIKASGEEKAGEPLIRTFSYHYRDKFGQVIGKIPVDLGLICPNRQKGGCIYCRPSSFTPAYLSPSVDVLTQIQKGKAHFLKGRFRKYFAYFQQETCTAVATEKLLKTFGTLLTDDDCVGLIISTRPDYIYPGLLQPLAELIGAVGKDCLFELGVQTVHEKSLKLLNRNHSFEDFRESASLIKSFDCFELGAHLIFGIPDETEEEMLHSLKTICSLQVDALKLHHLQVIRHTALEEMYEDDKVTVFTLDQYCNFLLKALPLIPARVTIHRLWATSHPKLLVAPKWNVLASQLSKIMVGKMEAAGIWQGKEV
ncbi:MAG: TIGR01212 family radical SAM protein [Desulfobulbaceae bacterium]|nr:TIGR01212 family radical SAM protein [Desulfobulbaceae bacterium]